MIDYGAEDRPAVVALSLPRSPRCYLLYLCTVGAVEVTTSVALTIVAPMLPTEGATGLLQ